MSNIGDDLDLCIVGRWIGPSWEFQGVFDSESKALAACRDETYFVGYARLNVALPHESSPWPDCWYPLAKVAVERG